MRFLLLGLMLFFNVVSAQAEESVYLTVKAVLASNNGEEVSQSLNPFLDDLRSVFDYSSYTFVNEYNIEFDQNVKDRIILPYDEDIVVSYNGKENDQYKLNVACGALLDTDILIRSGGKLILGGRSTKDGKLLLILNASK